MIAKNLSVERSRTSSTSKSTYKYDEVSVPGVSLNHLSSVGGSEKDGGSKVGGS